MSRCHPWPVLFLAVAFFLRQPRKMAPFNQSAGSVFVRTRLVILQNAGTATASPALPGHSLRLPALVPGLSAAPGIGAISGLLLLLIAVLAFLASRLRKHKTLLDDLFENATEAVALTSPDGLIIRVNRRFTEVFGYASQAAAGRLLSELIVPEESQAEYRVQADKARRQRVDTAGVGRRQDGSRFPAAIGLVPVVLPGKGAATCVIYRDITQLRHAEEAQWANEGRWRAIFDNSAVGIAVTDAAGKFLATNRAYEEMVGYSEEELRAISFMDLTWEEDRAANAALFTEMRAGRLPQFTLEKRYRRKDGRSIWVRVTVLRSPGDSTTPLFGIAIVEDITERKRAEDRLREYEKVVEGLQEMIVVVGRDYRYLIANQAFLNYHGLKREEVVGHLVSEFVGQETFEKVTKNNVDECFRGRVVTCELAVTFPNLGRRDLRGSYFPIEGPGGIDRIAVVLEDVTERKKAERDLQLSFCELQALNAQLQSVREEERTRLARELHDRLGQSLTAIRIDLASVNAVAGPEPVSGKIASIIRLIDESIRTVRRISTELRPGILDDLGLVAALEWAAEEFQARTGIQCQASLPEANPAIDAERATALFRIFQETLTNIARHAGATQVTVALSQESGYLSLEVRDNGRGIDKEQLTASDSLGILGMRERALLLGGEFFIGKPNGGTIVRVRMPLGAGRPVEAGS